MAKAKTEVAEVVESPVQAVKAIDTMDMQEFLTWLETEGASVVEFDGGSAWTLTKKESLIGVPFVIAGFQWNETTKGDFMSVRIFLEDGTKAVFNDGGTGIPQQLRTYEEKHNRNTAILCKQGLRVSEYTYTDPKDGKEKPAETYYIA